MFPRAYQIVLGVILVMLIGLMLPSPSNAESVTVGRMADSAYDLINAVNALRASNGLPPYSINTILMYTAQNQAEFMAATGTVIHYGPGGIGLTDRLLAAGYPLAGDLSLGGFRSENIISGVEGMSAQSAIDQWTGDAPHITTMLSTDLTEIGAGVAVANGRVYYVIDAAHPTVGGVSQGLTQVTDAGTTVPMSEPSPIALVVSTANANGEVVHDVLPGQTLWQIAISYNVKIDEIKRLNGLIDDYIFPGEKLMIAKKGLSSMAIPTETPFPTQTEIPPKKVMPGTTAPNAIHVAPASPDNSKVDLSNSHTIMWSVIGIILLALVAGGVFTWMGDNGKPRA